MGRHRRARRLSWEGGEKSGSLCLGRSVAGGHGLQRSDPRAPLVVPNSDRVVRVGTEKRQRIGPAGFVYEGLQPGAPDAGMRGPLAARGVGEGRGLPALAGLGQGEQQGGVAIGGRRLRRCGLASPGRGILQAAHLAQEVGLMGRVEPAVRTCFQPRQQLAFPFTPMADHGKQELSREMGQGVARIEAQGGANLARRQRP